MKNPSNPGGATNKEDNYPYKRMYTYSQVLTSIWVFKVMEKKKTNPTSFASLVHKGVFPPAQAQFLCTSAPPQGSPLKRAGGLVKPVENYWENAQAGVLSWTELFGFLSAARALWVSSASCLEERQSRVSAGGWLIGTIRGSLSGLLASLWHRPSDRRRRRASSKETLSGYCCPDSFYHGCGSTPNMMLVKETFIVQLMFRFDERLC